MQAASRIRRSAQENSKSASVSIAEAPARTAQCRAGTTAMLHLQRPRQTSTVLYSPKCRYCCTPPLQQHLLSLAKMSLCFMCHCVIVLQRDMNRQKKTSAQVFQTSLDCCNMPSKRIWRSFLSPCLFWPCSCLTFFAIHQPPPWIEVGQRVLPEKCISSAKCQSRQIVATRSGCRG